MLKKLQDWFKHHTPPFATPLHRPDKEKRPPRFHHYVFAHRALPTVFYSTPARFMEMLRTDGQAFLSGLWDKVGEDSLARQEPRLPAANIAYAMEQAEVGIETAVIILPKPERIAEAFFAAVIYRPATTGGPYYCTLEMGIHVSDGTPRTVFCGWTADNTHENWGTGPEPEIESFRQHLRAWLAQPDRQPNANLRPGKP